MVLVLLVIWVGLFFLLTAGTFALQGYLNETPPNLGEVAIRALVGATVLAAFLGLWCWLSAGNPERWATLTEFSITKEGEYFKEIKAKHEGQWHTYYRVKDTRGLPYYSNSREGKLPARPEELIVTEDGEESHFLPERDKEGKLKIEYGRRLRYRDSQGRIMEEGFLGQITTTRVGWLLSYVLLNLAHGLVWMVAAWPVMRFSFWQAVAISIVAWPVVTLFVMPPLLRQASGGKPTAVQQTKQEGEPCGSPSCTGTGASRQARSCHFEATEEGNSILTFTSWPARTATRSVRTSPFTSAFSV